MRDVLPIPQFRSAFLGDNAAVGVCLLRDTITIPVDSVFRWITVETNFRADTIGSVVRMAIVKDPSSQSIPFASGSNVNLIYSDGMELTQFGSEQSVFKSTQIDMGNVFLKANSKIGIYVGGSGNIQYDYSVIVATNSLSEWKTFQV